MMIIYIVTAGSYSDYHICAVFSTEALAQAYIDRYDWGIDDPEIEPYEVDDIDPMTNLDSYIVSMRIDGNEAEAKKIIMESGHQEAYIWKYNGKGITVYCWARDKTHAIKIANEKRAQMIARGEA